MPDVWPMPDSISPSRMGLWYQCPLKFRVETIQKLRGGTNAAAVAGTCMHAAYENFMQLPGPERTAGALAPLIEQALVEIRETDEYKSLTEVELVGFDDKCRRVAPRALDMLDLQAMNVESTEQRLEVDLDGWILRGIIDLLEDRPDFGRICWDWKTGKPPRPQYVEKALLGLEFYAVMIRRHFGQIPAGVGLLYVAARKSIKRVPTPRTVDETERKILKVRDEIATACETGNFVTKTSVLCDWCDLKPVCPAHGGSEDDIETLVALRS
jgi:putative RecB family exonuclease